MFNHFNPCESYPANIEYTVNLGLVLDQFLWGRSLHHSGHRWRDAAARRSESESESLDWSGSKKLQEPMVVSPWKIEVSCKLSLKKPWNTHHEISEEPVSSMCCIFLDDSKMPGTSELVYVTGLEFDLYLDGYIYNCNYICKYTYIYIYIYINRLIPGGAFLHWPTNLRLYTLCSMLRL